MNTCEKIKAKLVGYPDVRFLEGPSAITVTPSDESGFRVAMLVRDDRFTVYFDGWHEEFESEEEALDCFAFGLSTSCRLAVVMRGSTPVKWIVEAVTDGIWRADSETGLLLQPFWRTARVVYRQNKLIKDRS